MKSYAREVAGAILVTVFALLLTMFFTAPVDRIVALTPVFMGFCAPVAITCLGMFGVRSYQNRKEPS